METGLMILGLGIAVGTLTAILWSIVFPERRLWPPSKYTAMTPILVWVPTFTLFGVLILLGVLGWGELSIPNWIRFGVGVSLVLIGNVVVWTEVFYFGISQTGGAVGNLRTSGFYRYTRNPQYMADIVMICGWMILSAAPYALLLGFSATAILAIAPFSEEPWLREQYGSDFDAYAKTVRRFI